MGSIIAREVMTQRPAGIIYLTDKDGTREVAFDGHNLYVYSHGPLPKLLTAKGAPLPMAWTTLSPWRSKKSAVTGCSVNVDYGNI